jgi:integrase/recombinase XerD
MTALHKLFVRVHTRYTRSTHAADLANFARWLIEHEYSARYAQRLVFRALRSLEGFDRPPGSKWTMDALERAFRNVRQQHSYRHARRAFAAFLQSGGRLARPADNGPHTSVLAAYERFLSEVRGLASTTIAQHLAEVGALLRQTLSEGEPLKRLTAEAIEQHIQRRARTVSRASLRTTAGYLRSFLSHCFERRWITTRLDALDQPVGFRNERPPRALEWRTIQQFLRSIKRKDQTSWRDFMVLHLMAHYGLRNGEITRLKIESINWSDRTLLVEQVKTHSWLTLPLMDQTLDLLRRYLQEGRRWSRCRELFLCAFSPARPMTKCSVSQMFKVRARQSGLPIKHASAYALRHSFAMRLFARGVGMKAIGDLMGHHSLASTSVYLRLQSDVLREVALPVPGKLEAAVGGDA